MAERKRRRQTENYFDYSLLFIVLFLLGFGLVMIYSTSCYEANMQGHESTFYLKKQVMDPANQYLNDSNGLPCFFPAPAYKYAGPQRIFHGL